MLNQDQKNLVREWVAAGRSDKEIIALAGNQNPPFTISRQNIYKNYRKQTERKVRETVRAEKETDALRSGLAVKEERIRMLQETAEYVYGQIREIPASKANLLPSFINAMRGCLDDIAKELGQRSNKVDVNANVRVRDIVAIVDKVYGDRDRPVEGSVPVKAKKRNDA